MIPWLENMSHTRGRCGQYPNTDKLVKDHSVQDTRYLPLSLSQQPCSPSSNGPFSKTNIRKTPLRLQLIQTSNPQYILSHQVF